MRRRGDRLRLRLLVGVNPGKAEQARSALAAGSPIRATIVELPDQPEERIPPEEAARQAAELAERAGTDRPRKVIYLPQLIKLWKAAGNHEKVVHWKYFGMAFYCNVGYYADALRYGDGLLEMAAQHIPDSGTLQWWVINKMLSALTGLGEAEAGLRLAEGDGLRLIPNVAPEWRSHLYYLVAMLHARYSKPRDFVKGERYLDQGLEMIQQANVPESDRAFFKVFNRNGVAMIRSFEGRHQEAMELCQTGIAELNAQLGMERQRLHRSILHYNIAQVYVAMGSYTEALEYYSAAMAMDPNYSEYYNERGSIFLRLGRLESARADYLRAIELSPPYFEVLTNLGQCHRRMGEMAEAVKAYSRALDLEPDQPLALVGRAKAHDELGHTAEAIADYSAALAHDGKQWELLGNRGVMYYQAGDLPASLKDFDRAIELAPDLPDLYRNRATVLGDLGRQSEAKRDLAIALRLSPAERAAG